MTLEITYHNDGRRKVTRDKFNPRVYIVEWKCAGCGAWVGDESVVWAKTDGTLSTTDPLALSWCEACCPEQPDYEDKG